ncbi:MAG: sigma-54-dependent Fis family transcriptional regulator [Rhodospirillales bacterium]|nr:sigma-54-dependent Fis family transcriptional regulator [Rhodospirillales bacterium]
MRVLVLGSLATELGTAARMVRARGGGIVQADTEDAALAALRRDGTIGIVFADLARDLAGLIAALRAERIGVPVVACAVAARADEAVAAIRAGAREFLPLPPDADIIAALLAEASGDANTPIARDPAMLACLARAEQIAGSDATVLITGESGTGKEVLAHHIHRHSRRAGARLVALNCAAIPETLLESELFGHEKGAFSGALARRIGKFEAADGGTLLLDEIAELDIRLQAKLLRALQQREIDRVGGEQPVRVDVRVLAATNRDLRAEVEAGRFREDLLFRLDVIALRLPPLRERPLDIAPLATHFVRRYATLNGLPERALTPAAISCLSAHTWRGNVRELENAIHRAVLLAAGSSIEAEDIEINGTAAPTRSVPGTETQAVPPPSAGTLAGLVGRRMEDLERDFILETLHRTEGNRTHAASMLGISIRALRNKLRDYTRQGLPVPPPASGIA